MAAVPALSLRSGSPRLEQVAVLEGHTDRVWHAAWHPRAPLLATASGDKTVRFWQPRSLAEPRDARVAAAAAAGGAGDTPGGGYSSPAGAAAAAAAAAVPMTPTSPTTARSLASRVWRCVGSLADFTTRTVRCCEWSPDGRFLACTSFDGKAYVWAMVQVVEDDAPQFDESASAGPRELSLELAATLEGHENEVKGCAWSSTGALLATCGRDKSVWLWGMDEGGEGDMEVVAVLHGHSQDVKAVAWHPDRELLFSASYDDTVRVWADDGADWLCVASLTGHSSTVWGLSFNASGSMLATVSDDCRVLLWAGSEPARPSDVPPGVVDLLLYRRAGEVADAHTRTIFTVDWTTPSESAATASRHRELLATAGADDAIHLYAPALPADTDATAGGGGAGGKDITIAPVASRPHAHAQDINCLRWHPRDTNLLVSTSDDGTAKLWRFHAQ